MPTSPTPLEVEGYHVDAIHLDTNSNYDESKESSGSVDVDFGVYPHPDDALRFHVAMTIDIETNEETNEPYALHLDLSAFFTFKPDTTTETAQKMLFSNAVPILYGIARGCVGQITGTALYGAVMLPPYNFVELAARKKEAHAALEGRDVTPQLPSEQSSE